MSQDKNNQMNEHFNDFVNYIFVVLILGLFFAVIFADDYVLATTGYSLSGSDSSAKIGYYIGMVATAAWSYFYLYKLKSRKNWARILLALGCLFVVFTALNTAKITFRISILWGVTFMINCLLQFYILYLAYFDKVVAASFKSSPVAYVPEQQMQNQVALNNNTPGNFSDELTKLHTLFQTGALNEDEYKSAKAIVLKKMNL